jgi:hypothetical protein
MADVFAPPGQFATASDQLHAAAAARAGSSNFGDPDYLLGLRMLLQSMDYDPVFSEQGRAIAWSQLIDALSSRAFAFASMARHPGFDARPIERPIVITGVPRTGTTALHKLMAVDPQFQGFEKWLLGAPMPRPPRSEWEGHPMFRREVEILEARYEVTPGLRAAHYMAAEEIEECLWILRQGFVSNYWPCNWSAASYDAWWQTQSEAPSYDYLRRNLQLIGLGDTERRWLLKNPGHIANLDLLFETFPDALVIQTHRDPAKAIPSLCGLLIQAHAVIERGSEQLHAHIMGHRETAKWAKAVRDAEPVRQAHPRQVVDVIHREFHADPIGVIRRIYGFLGLELSPPVEAAMRERVAAAPELAHGEHRYHVSDFDQTEDEIRERFGDYVDRFDLRPKGAPR